MLLTYFGTDIIKARSESKKMIDSLLARDSDAQYFRITDENAEEFNSTSITASQGLFKQAYIVLLDNLFSDKERREDFLKELNAFVESPHVFMVLEETLTPILKRELKKVSKKFIEHGVGGGQKKFGADFAFTDSFMAKDKKAMWVQLQKQLQNGKRVEELHGTLFWVVKSLILAQSSMNADEAGMKEYPFKKAKVAAQKFKEEELRQRVLDLQQMPQKAYEQNIKLEVLLERWILSF